MTREPVAWLITWNGSAGKSVSFDKCHTDDGTCVPLFTAPPAAPVRATGGELREGLPTVALIDSLQSVAALRALAKSMLAAAPAQATGGELRERFEAVFSTGHVETDRANFTRHRDTGNYIRERIGTLWEGFQAAAPLPTLPAGDVEWSAVAWMRTTAVSLGVGHHEDSILTLGRALTGWIDEKPAIAPGGDATKELLIDCWLVVNSIPKDSAPKAELLRRIAAAVPQVVEAGDGRGGHGYNCGVNAAIVGECSCGLAALTHAAPQDGEEVAPQ